MEYWSFDLVAYLGGQVASTPKGIASMIQSLPEGSRWYAYNAAHKKLDGKAGDEKPDPEAQAYAEARVWNFDRQLLAMLINAVHQNTQVSGMWEKGKTPEFPVIGPTSWAKPKNLPAPGPEDPADLLAHHLTRLGMPAGGGRR